MPGPSTLAFTVEDTRATHAVAGAVASLLQPGDVVVLTGDLGAGKTTFTQGVAAALGVSGVVTSPTFALVQIYPTAAGFDLVHADFYRIGRLAEAVDLGLAELVDDGSVAVVEWGERALSALPPDYLTVTIEAPEADGERRVLHLTATGTHWQDRLMSGPSVLRQAAMGLS